MEHNCGFINDKKAFRYRAAAIIVEEGCVLFARNDKDDYYYSVGGAVHMGETSEEAVKREVLQQLGYFVYIRAERAGWTRMGYKGRELNEALEFSKKEFITKHISEYANKNEREFFAECFAEYLMSERPREAAKIFGEVLKEIMEGLR